MLFFFGKNVEKIKLLIKMFALGYYFRHGSLQILTTTSNHILKMQTLPNHCHHLQNQRVPNVKLTIILVEEKLNPMETTIKIQNSKLQVQKIPTDVGVIQMPQNLPTNWLSMRRKFPKSKCGWNLGGFPKAKTREFYF